MQRWRHTCATTSLSSKPPPAPCSFQTHAITDFGNDRNWDTIKFYRLALFVTAVKRVGFFIN